MFSDYVVKSKQYEDKVNKKISLVQLYITFTKRKMILSLLSKRQRTDCLFMGL